MSQTERHPSLSLLLLIVLALAGALVFTILGVVIAGSIYGFNHILYTISAPASWKRNEIGMMVLKIIMVKFCQYLTVILINNTLFFNKKKRYQKKLDIKIHFFFVKKKRYR